MEKVLMSLTNHKQRESSIELLRIISMFFILTYHFCSYLKNVDVDNRFVLCGYSILHIGVPVFILISGYFTIKLKLSKVVYLYLYLLFWYIVSYLFGVFVLSESFTWQELLKQFLVFTYTQGRWFVPFYFCLMLLSSVIGGGNLSKKSYSLLILVLSLYLVYVGLVRRGDIVNDGKSLFYFVYMYLLGGYIRVMSDIFVNKSNAKWYGLSWGALALFVIFVTLTIPHQYAKAFRGLAFAYDGPLLLISACLALLLFLCISFQLNWLNSISEGAFAVYLFHENIHVSGFYKNIVLRIFTHSDGVLTISLLTLFAILIMFGVLAVDLIIRKPIQSLIQPRLERFIGFVFQRLDNKINSYLQHENNIIS